MIYYASIEYFEDIFIHPKSLNQLGIKENKDSPYHKNIINLYLDYDKHNWIKITVLVLFSCACGLGNLCFPY